MKRPHASYRACHRIFGKGVDFDLLAGPSADVLRTELRIYPACVGESWLSVRTVDTPFNGELLRNPDPHLEFDDGFAAIYGATSVRYRFQEGMLTKLEMHVRQQSTLRGAVGKWRSRQFTTRLETIGQRLHELALLPAAYARPELILMHASAFSLPDGGAVLVGGTGGVGKTTLGIDLCMRHGAGFLADDIAVLDLEGAVHPNLAYPKIYAYNVVGDGELHHRMFADSSLGDRAHWAATRMRGGLGWGRRRRSPAQLYPNVETKPTTLRKYVLLVRDHGQSVRAETLSAAGAASLSTSVMATEQSAFQRHLAWHEFNRGVMGLRPLLQLREVLDRWKHDGEQRLRSVDCILVKAPLGLAHSELRDRLREIILAN